MQEIVISTCLRYRKLLFPLSEVVISRNGNRYCLCFLRNVLCRKGLRAILEPYNSIIIENKIAIIIDGNLTIAPLFLS